MSHKIDIIFHIKFASQLQSSSTSPARGDNYIKPDKVNHSRMAIFSILITIQTKDVETMDRETAMPKKVPKKGYRGTKLSKSSSSLLKGTF